MCGIVGYVGQRAVQEVLLAGLEKLEYRGYDSAGISVIAGDEIESVRAVGNLDRLREAVANGAGGDEGSVAVATRPAQWWAITWAMTSASVSLVNTAPAATRRSLSAM